MTTGVRYDKIGHGYARGRHPDDRLRQNIVDALGSSVTVVNVGAGTGNYEPVDRLTVALEPSAVMIAQRPPGTARVVCGVAEALPFADRSFDAAMAVSTVHHWSDLAVGLAEMSRGAARRVVYFSEPSLPEMYWLIDEYFPSILSMPINQAAPSAERVVELLGGECEVRVFAIPRDFAEASAGGFWARPEAYCDPAVQGAMSMFALLDPSDGADGVARLRADLASGAWDRRHGHLRQQDELDLGYRIVVSTAQ
ncbi:MAG: methyltransferase domain-containing protein [Acidimicrobiales bacterium]